MQTSLAVEPKEDSLVSLWSGSAHQLTMYESVRAVVEYESLFGPGSPFDFPW